MKQNYPSIPFIISSKKNASMRSIVGSARLILLAVVIVILFFLVVGVFPVVPDSMRVRMVKRWAPRVLRVLGIRLDVKGRIPNAEAASGLREDGPGYLVCANHISFADIFVLDSILPVRFIAKKEISKYVGTIFIDRSSRRAIVDVVDVMDKHLARGENVLFFPEGTTGPGDALLPFYANLFSAAKPAEYNGLEVLPITLKYYVNGIPSTIPSYASRDLFTVLKDIVKTKNVSVEATILTPIKAAAYDRRTLCAETSRAMAEALGWPDATAAKAEALRAKLAKTGTEKASAAE